MPQFICAVSTSSSDPAAYALAERASDGSYAIRAFDRFDGDPVETIQNLLADEQQYAGHATLVVMGGQKMADRFSKAGLSAVPVVVAASGGSDVVQVSEQTLVDTFEAVYRHRAVEMPNEREEASAVLAALYGAMSDDAGAGEASPEMEDLVQEEVLGIPADGAPNGGAAPAVPELSGSSASLSAAKIGGDEHDRTATVADALTASPSHGLEDARNAGPVDLGEHRDLALALTLACWYGEYSSGDLAPTDQADETPRASRVRDKRRRQARDKLNR